MSFILGALVGGGSKVSKKKTATEIINDFILNSINKNISQCLSKTNQSQVLDVSCDANLYPKILNSQVCINLSGNEDKTAFNEICRNPCTATDIQQTMNLSIDTNCEYLNQMTENIKNDIKKDMDNYVKSRKDMLANLMGKIDEENKTSISSKIANNITNENVNKGLNEAKQLQSIISSNSTISGISQSMISKNILKAITNNNNIKEIVTDLDNKLTNKNISKTDGLFTTITDGLGVVGDTAKTSIKTVGKVADTTIKTTGEVINNVTDMLSGPIIIGVIGAIIFILFKVKTSADIPEQYKKHIIGGIIVLGIVLLASSYYSTMKDKKEEKKTK